MTSQDSRAAGEPGIRLWRRAVSVAVAGLVTFVVVVAALLAISVSGVLPLSGFQNRIARAVEQRLGPEWQVQIATAGLDRFEGRSAVRITDVVLTHRAGMAVRAPQAVLSYDPWSILRGWPTVSAIDIRGVQLRLGVDDTGAIVLDAGSAPVKLGGGGFDLGIAAGGGGSAILGMLAAVDLMARDGGELAALESASLSNSRLTLVDETGRERIAFDQVALRLRPVESGRRVLDMSARGPSGQKEFTIDLATTEDGGRRASIELRRFEPADVFGLVVGDRWGGLEGLAISGRMTVETRKGAEAAPRAQMALSIAPGQLVVKGVFPEPLDIDGGTIDVALDVPAGTAQIQKLAFKAGATDMVLSGGVKRTPEGLWTAELAGSGQAAGDPGDPVVRLDAWEAGFEGRPDGGVDVKRWLARGPTVDARGSGSVANRPEGPGLRVDLAVGPSDARSVLALWPRFASPEVRALLSRRLKAGAIDEMNLALDLPPADFVKAQTGAPIPDESVRLAARGRNVKFLVADGLPLLTDATVSAVSTGRTLAVEAGAARVDLGRDRTLQLSEGGMTIADTYAPRPLGKVAFRATGGLDALAALLATPTLRDYAPSLMDPEGLRGTVDLRTALSIPLVEDIKPADVQVVSNGTFANVASDTLLGREKLEGANLKASYERGVLTLKGEGRVGGLPGQIEVRQDAKGTGEASLTATLDQAARQKRGIALEGIVTGPIQVKATQALGKAVSQPPRIEVDLARAAIDGLPGWSKPAGKPGKLSFVLSSGADGTELDDFQLEAAPLLLKGKVELDRQGGLERASLATRISPGDDMRVEIVTEGSVSKVTVRGKVGDARPFLKLGDAKADKRDPDIDIDLQVPILTGFNNEAIGNAVLKASRRQGEWRSLTFDGRIGKAPVSARVSGVGGTQVLLVQTDDGGGLMRFYDVYRRAFGGDLVLSVPLGESRAVGTLLYREFAVRGEPALRRVLTETPAGVGGDRAGGGGRVEVSEVPFTKLRAEFTRTPTRIDIKEAVMWGPLVGFTAQGSLDYARDRVDIAGTFVPAYAFNNAFAQVPIFGRLLGGGQYEGLFAVNFRIAGSPAAPTTTVNPLSAIAPGILRRFVDPGGGTPLGELPTGSTAR